MNRSAMAAVEVVSGDVLATLGHCGGYYECPKTPDGKRLGPLVAYAGRDETGKQFVGDVYANFAMADEFPNVMTNFAYWMARGIGPFLGQTSVFCGAPLGGYIFAHELGRVWDRRVIKAEKRVTTLATAGSREKTELVFARSEPRPGDSVVWVEDVANNFSTTKQGIELILRHRAVVVAIACILNRSLTVEDTYTTGIADGGTEVLCSFPVIALLRKPIPEYRQDDPAVVDDIVAGNVVWKPKDEWDRLSALMSGMKK